MDITNKTGLYEGVGLLSSKPGGELLYFNDGTVIKKGDPLPQRAVQQISLTTFTKRIGDLFRSEAFNDDRATLTKCAVSLVHLKRRVTTELQNIEARRTEWGIFGFVISLLYYISRIQLERAGKGADLGLDRLRCLLATDGIHNALRMEESQIPGVVENMHFLGRVSIKQEFKEFLNGLNTPDTRLPLFNKEGRIRTLDELDTETEKRMYELSRGDFTFTAWEKGEIRSSIEVCIGIEIEGFNSAIYKFLEEKYGKEIVAVVEEELFDRCEEKRAITGEELCAYCERLDVIACLAECEGVFESESLEKRYEVAKEGEPTQITFNEALALVRKMGYSSESFSTEMQRKLAQHLVDTRSITVVNGQLYGKDLKTTEGQIIRFNLAVIDFLRKTGKTVSVNGSSSIPISGTAFVSLWGKEESFLGTSWRFSSWTLPTWTSVSQFFEDGEVVAPEERSPSVTINVDYDSEEEDVEIIASKPSSERGSGASSPSIEAAAPVDDVPASVAAAPEARRPDFKFPLTAEQGEMVAEIIRTVADTSVPGLALEKSRLEELGRALEEQDVQPLEFLAHVFTNPKVMNNLNAIRKGWMGKWALFIPGPVEELSRYLGAKGQPQFAMILAPFFDELNIATEDRGLLVADAICCRWQQFIEKILDKKLGK